MIRWFEEFMDKITDYFYIKTPEFTDEQMKRFEEACCGDNDGYR